MPTRDLALAFQALFDRLPHAIVLVDAQRRISAVNPAFTRLFGYTPEEVVGRVPTFMYAVEDDAHDLGEPQFLRALKQRGAIYEARYRRKDGTEFWAESAGVGVLDADGRAAGVIGVHVDVSARHAAEERLQRANAEMADLVRQRTAELAAANAELARRADVADEANRAKSTFLATMSHEIRTPMNAIIGLTHLLAQELHDPQHRDRLAKIDDAAKHLLGIINDILDLSKIEAGKMTLREADFSLEEVMAGAMQMVSAAAQQKGLELILDVDHLPQHARGDATRLSQALINLLANAVKFTDQGWVRLKGGVSADDGRRFVLRFEVQDTGPGIEPERLARLFAPFEQADTSPTRRQGGTGLGLALTRHLARLMGGDAGASSVPGQGSVFWVQVGLLHAERASERAAPLSLAGRRALIVDDLPEALAAEAERLSLFGMDVTTASDGEQALERVQEAYAAGRTFDVVLVDWRMPTLDGIQTIAAMRRLLGAGMPPTLLFTAYADPRLRELAAQVGCREVLDKPATPSGMLDTLMRMLRPSAAAPPASASASEDADSLRSRLAARHGGQRVLLVEDNPVNREVATHLLQLVQLVVETAEDGARAVTLAGARPYDLVLMDVQMPGMDGLEATRRIRRAMGPALAVVAMTANAFDDDREACIEAGMNDHLAKPVDPERLYQVLLKWLPLRAASSTAPGIAGGVEAPAAMPEDIDQPAALHRVGGSRKAMEHVWRRFAEHYRDGDPALKRAVDASDRQALLAATHALAGACGNVGANGLEQQARSVQDALRQDTDAAAPFAQARALDEALGRLARQLGAALDLSARRAP